MHFSSERLTLLPYTVNPFTSSQVRPDDADSTDVARSQKTATQVLKSLDFTVQFENRSILMESYENRFLVRLLSKVDTNVDKNSFLFMCSLTLFCSLYFPHILEKFPALSETFPLIMIFSESTK